VFGSFVEMAAIVADTRAAGRTWSALPSPPSVRPTIESEQRDDIASLRPYSVILHNDDVNDMTHVVQSLRRSVPTLSAQQAVSIMMEAHERGKAVVIQCPLEHAELYRDRLESCGLTATIEKG
jgi:ATP-dependent Clp protease adapter protein ClpS